MTITIIYVICVIAAVIFSVSVAFGIHYARLWNKAFKIQKATVVPKIIKPVVVTNTEGFSIYRKVKFGAMRMMSPFSAMLQKKQITEFIDSQPTDGVANDTDRDNLMRKQVCTRPRHSTERRQPLGRRSNLAYRSRI